MNLMEGYKLFPELLQENFQSEEEYLFRSLNEIFANAPHKMSCRCALCLSGEIVARRSEWPTLIEKARALWEQVKVLTPDRHYGLVALLHSQIHHSDMGDDPLFQEILDAKHK